ncbi:MAG TPA: hypothetical protein VF897_06270, partial [Roseiflexaceae bacterium]
MANIAEIEASLAASLPAALHTHIPRLAQLLADATNGAGSPDILQQRLAAEPALSPLLAELAGQSLCVGATRFTFGAEQLLGRAVGGPAAGVVKIGVSDNGHDRDVSERVDRRQGVAISGGVVEGVVVGFNEGTINYTRVTVDIHYGTLLGAGAPPTIVRCALPQPPLPALHFYDREQPLSELATAIQPRHGAWLTGPSGCGMTTLLKQAANTPAARTLPDGVLYLDGALKPADSGDLLQCIYSSFFKGAGGETIRPNPNTARTELGNLQALFLLDRPRLEPDALAGLAEALAGRGAGLRRRHRARLAARSTSRRAAPAGRAQADRERGPRQRGAGRDGGAARAPLRRARLPAAGIAAGGPDHSPAGDLAGAAGGSGRGLARRA